MPLLVNQRKLIINNLKNEELRKFIEETLKLMIISRERANGKGSRGCIKIMPLKNATKEVEKIKLTRTGKIEVYVSEMIYERFNNVWKDGIAPTQNEWINQLAMKLVKVKSD